MTKTQHFKTLSVSVLALSALALGACASHQPRQAEVARLGCDQLGAGVASDHLAPGKISAVSRVTAVDFKARALQPERVIGADLYVHAEPGVTSEYLERALSCHAQAGQPAHANDPLHPSTGTVAVKVRSSEGGFAVRAIGSTHEAGREIWQRAEALTRPGVQIEQVASSSTSSTL